MKLTSRMLLIYAFSWFVLEGKAKRIINLSPTILHRREILDDKYSTLN